MNVVYFVECTMTLTDNTRLLKITTTLVCERNNTGVSEVSHSQYYPHRMVRLDLNSGSSQILDAELQNFEVNLRAL